MYNKKVTIDFKKTEILNMHLFATIREFKKTHYFMQKGCKSAIHLTYNV